ncbi:MAG: hypothetical protein M3340_05975 [Actinomycetota bacterium]|nr:hypothetical protein [Actinomycetota bacterium]
MDAAIALIGQFVDKLQEAPKHELGIPCVCTPAGSTKTVTFYVLSGEIPDLPRTHEAGWFAQAPSLEFKLVARPFGYGEWVETIVDGFSINSIGDYTFDTGSGTLAVSGGQLVPSSTSEKALYRSAEGLEYSDAQVGHKLTTGSTVTTNCGLGPTLRRLDASNFLYGELEIGIGGANSARLNIRKKDGGSFSILNPGAPTFTLNTASSYWLRLRAEGDLLTLELFTGSAPTPTSTAAQAVTHTLTGANKTKFGQGVSGDVGIRTNLVPTDYRYDDFVIEPNLWRSSQSLVIGTIGRVPGDVPAEARAIFTDAAGQARRAVIWGVENRFYNSATSLQVNSSALVTTGFAGVSATRSGSFNTNVIRAGLGSTPVAVCGLGNLTHVGTFRVFARLYVSGLDIRLRLRYRDGDGPLSAADRHWITPHVSEGWVELDLGVITIPEAQLGTQRWTGQIEAYSESTGTITLDVDYVDPIPAGEGFGKARAPIAFETPTAFTARDEFNQSAGALAGKTLPQGGTWSGAGDADDFVVETVGKTAQRAAVSDAGPRATGRFAIAGTSVLASTLVQVDLKTSAREIARQGVVARYTDVNNWVGADVTPGVDGVSLVVQKVVAGTETGLHTMDLSNEIVTTWNTLRLVIDTAGRYFVWLFVTDGAPVLVCTGRDSALAAGGALASGKVGLLDWQPSATAVTRSYDNFVAATATENAVIFPGQSCEIRHDSAIREDASGTYWGPIASHRPAPRFLLPEAGVEGRTSRIAAMVRRADIEEMTADDAFDSTVLQVVYRARYLEPR